MRATEPKTDIHWRKSGSEQQPNLSTPNLLVSGSLLVPSGSWGHLLLQTHSSLPRDPKHGQKCLTQLSGVGGSC